MKNLSRFWKAVTIWGAILLVIMLISDTNIVYIALLVFFLGSVTDIIGGWINKETKPQRASYWIAGVEIALFLLFAIIWVVLLLT